MPRGAISIGRNPTSPYPPASSLSSVQPVARGVAARGVVFADLGDGARGAAAFARRPPVLLAAGLARGAGSAAHLPLLVLARHVVLPLRHLFLPRNPPAAA